MANGSHNFVMARFIPILFFILILMNCKDNKSKDKNDFYREDTIIEQDVKQQDDGGFIIKEQSDWDKMNLKGRVKKITEKWKRYTTYILFNEDGMIIEEGTWNSFWEKYRITEQNKYEGRRLIEKRSYEPGHYIVYKYDDNNDLVKEEHYYNKPTMADDEYDLDLEYSYRYEKNGKRKYNIYTNDILAKTIEYNQYKTPINEITYDKSGNIVLSLKTEYRYDNNGNILRYETYVSNKHSNFTQFNPTGRYIYGYDEDNKKISATIYTIKVYDNGKGGVNREENLFSHSDIIYDPYGNVLKDGDEYIYDDQFNWVKKTEITGDNTQERIIEYF